MKVLEDSEPALENPDDTLIGKLECLDDDVPPNRCFGLEIQNRHKDDLNRNKRNKLLECTTHTKTIQQKISIAENPLPGIQKEYRFSILESLVEQDSGVDTDNHDEEARNLVVNWLVLIHTKCSFEVETLHEAIRIFDRFLSARWTPVEEYEKFGLTAFWMSAKMEERKVKELKVWMTYGKGFLFSEIIDSEQEIMQALQNKLISNTPQRFLFNFATFFSLQPKAFTLCNYLLELTLLETSYLHYPSSIVALSSLKVCGKILRHSLNDSSISQLIERLTTNLCLPTRQLQQCSRKLCRSLQRAPSHSLNSIYRKYCSRRYLRVALIQLGQI